MNVLWLQTAGCGGCTMSLLCAEDPNVFDLLAGAGVRFLWHPALSLESGEEVRAILAGIESGEIALDVLCIEGAIATGPKGTGRYQMLSGTGVSLLDWVRRLAPRARCGGGGHLRHLWRRDHRGRQPVGGGRRAI